MSFYLLYVVGHHDFSVVDYFGLWFCLFLFMFLLFFVVVGSLVVLAHLKTNGTRIRTFIA